MKVSELREMSDDQLLHEMREAQQELFRLRFQAATERLDAPSSLKRLRQTISRSKTIIRQRELEAEKNAATSDAVAT